MPDPDLRRSDTLEQHNLEVTVDDERSARAKADALESSGVDARVTLDAPEDTRASLRADMRDEVEATVMGAGNVGPFTKSMTKGLSKWTVIGAIAGAAAFFLIALAVWPSATGIIATTAVGATAGATFGFVIGGFLGPRKHDEGHADAESRPVVGVHASSAEEISEAERIVQGDDVRRSDRINAAGRPAGPPSKDTRPLRGDTPT